MENKYKVGDKVKVKGSGFECVMQSIRKGMFSYEYYLTRYGQFISEELLELC